MAVWRVSTPAQLSAALSSARREAGMTQEELAAWAHVNRRYLTVLEQGRASLQVQRLLDVLNVLGYDMVIVPKGHPIDPAR
ncbi:helix-turn-helix domain-containing protein [Actinomycetes bacterium KLBMP 9797]